MFGLSGRRAVVVASALFVGSLASAVVAVQASASGGGSGPVRPASLPAPTPPPGVHVQKAAVTPNVLATNAHCGQTVSASLTLNGDLDCSAVGGSGLTVTANSVVLNLNGHTIFGPVHTRATALTSATTVNNSRHERAPRCALLGA